MKTTTRRSARLAAAFATTLLVSAVALSGCGPDLTQQVRSQVYNDVNALASLTSEDVSRYFSADDVAMLQSAGVDAVSFLGSVFEGVQCTVSSVEEQGQSAVAHAYVTARNLGGAFDAMRSELNSRLSSVEGRDGLKALDDVRAASESIGMFARYVQADAPVFQTTELDLVYVRDGASWRLADPQGLARALLGGFDPAAASAAAPAIADAAQIQTDSPYTSVVATVDDDGYATYTR